jgi:hypothetical protein
MKLILSNLFALHVLFTAFQVQTPTLHTKLSVTSGVLNIIATLAAALLSFIEDQRSVEPQTSS